MGGGGSGERRDRGGRARDLALAGRRWRAAGGRGAGRPRVGTAAARAGGLAPPPTVADAPVPLPTQLGPDDLHAAVMTVLPLLVECYDAAAAQRPLPGGRLSVAMQVVGEPEVGTLIDDATLGGDPALLADAELSECFLQTMLSVELPPTTEGTQTSMKVAVAFDE